MNLSVSTMMPIVVEERNDLGFKCHPIMLPTLGIFLKNFHRKSVHGLTLLHRSLKITHVYFLANAYLYSTILSWMAYVEFGWQSRKASA